MIFRGAPFVITGTSPAAAGTALVGAALPGLGIYDWFEFTAILAGGTGGVLDLCLQRRVSVADDVWADWYHFTQLSAGGAAKWAWHMRQGATVPTAVGTMVTAVPSNGTITLAANTFVGGHPGDAIRLIGVAGSGTSAGATQTVYVTPFKTYT